MPKGYKWYPGVCKKSGYLKSLSVRRTEEFVSNAAEIMEIEAWINWKIDSSDCIHLYGASDKLFHLLSRGRSHSSVISLREKKEDPGTTNLLVSHRGRCLGTRGECNEWQKMILERPLLVV
ncbi:hypothetical protein TNCV_1796101 [Trichonephila clavipes]|nr:hypothetical protein TNCV_1796101 [Trichonephila clavipes]